MSSPLPRPALVWVSLFALSSIGTGMVYPFSAVYVSEQLNHGPAGASAYFAVLPIATFIGAAASGRAADWSATLSVVMALVLQTTGYLLIAVVSDLPALLASCVVAGLGAGMFLTASLTALAQLVPPDLLPRIYGLRYLAMNVGIGAGALVAGLTVTLINSLEAYRLLFLLNALSFLPLLWYVWRRRDVPKKHSQAEDVDTSLQRSGSPISSRVLCLAGLQVLLVVAGFSQLNSSVPVQLTGEWQFSPALLSMFFFVNAVLVMTLQPWISRRVPTDSAPLALAAVPAVWLIGASAMVVMSVGPESARLWWIFGFVAMFSLGEVLYAVSFQTVVARSVSPSQLGRANAVTSATWAAGMAIGPIVGLQLEYSFSPETFWSFICVLNVVCLIVLMGMRPRLPLNRSVRT